MSFLWPHFLWLMLSLAELFPHHGLDVGDMTLGGSRRPGRSLDDRAKPPPKVVAPVAPGSYASAAIVLLSDGRRTTGVDTLAAAKLAADRGVRIYVVGPGTVQGEAPDTPIYLQLDEPTLREVARMTGGEYHHAATAQALRAVYRDLGSRLQVLRRETEISALAALVSAALATAAAALSLLWFAALPERCTTRRLVLTGAPGVRPPASGIVTRCPRLPRGASPCPEHCRKAWAGCDARHSATL